jgi:hypothetical protein
MEEDSSSACGKSDDAVKLKTCGACQLVKYCGRDCQTAHRNRHKKECKKRVAELHEEALVKEPPKHDDCPICFLMLSSTELGQASMSCCGQIICCGCEHAHYQQCIGRPSCPFYRAELPLFEEILNMLVKLVDSNHAKAIYQLQYKERYGQSIQVASACS